MTTKPSASFASSEKAASKIGGLPNYRARNRAIIEKTLVIFQGRISAIELHMASSRPGRVALHICTMLLTGHVAFAVAGIVREFAQVTR